MGKATKPRTAAQKRATAKMIAANRRRKGSGGRRSSGRAPAVHHKRPSGETYTVAGTGAKLAVTAGAVAGSWTGLMDGQAPIQRALSGDIKGAAAGVFGNVKKAIQARQIGTSNGPALIGAGVAVAGVGYGAKKLGIKSPSLKLGKVRIRLWKGGR